jgi:hypothetical protein
MHMTDRGLLALARHEGIVPAPYLDVKRVWTFGVGHTAGAGEPDPVRMLRGMPANLDAGVGEALRLFRADLARYEAEVLRAVTPHAGYALSQQRRKKIEEPFGWAKTIGGMAQTVHRGFDRVRARFTLTMAACNLARLPKLLAA